MTETTEQELKEKLLKFAGINWSDDQQSWHYPDDSYYDSPDFTHSLDDCIEFLGPKFEAWEIKYIGYHNGIPKYRATVEYYSEEYIAYSEFPARAFCRAVEKLIDAGDK